MQNLKEEKLVEIVIDLNEIKKNRLDESFLAMFAGSSVPVSVSGKPREVASFADAIGKEKKYIDAAKKHGLDDPRTFKDKAKLKKATNAFERVTGIKWPFK